MKHMKSFIKYPGGKQKELPLINKYKPKVIGRYFEPFLGGGSVFFDIGIKKTYINDFSSDLIALYVLVKNNNLKFKQILLDLNCAWKELENDDYSMFKDLGISKISFDNYFQKMMDKKNATIKKLNNEGLKISSKDLDDFLLTSKKSAFYMAIRDIYNQRTNDLLHIAAFYFIREYCYSSMFRFSKKGNFNVPYGGKSYNYKYISNKIEYMFSCELQNYMKNTKIYCEDFEKFINSFDMNQSDFIFLDPPYDSDFSTYDLNPFDKKEQIRLCECLKNVKAKWMLIIKKTDFIVNLYKDFYMIEYKNQYMVSIKNRNKREVVHLMITNYKIKDK